MPFFFCLSWVDTKQGGRHLFLAGDDVVVHTNGEMDYCLALMKSGGS